MFELIATGILIALVIFFSLLIKRAFTKPIAKDDIELQRFDVMKCGPFSGQSNFYKRKVEVIISALLTPLAIAEVDVTTLDNWHIGTFTEHELIASKKSITTKSAIGFSTKLPFCIAADPYLFLDVSEGNYNKGDKLKAEMVVDKQRGRDVNLKLIDIYEVNQGLIAYVVLEEFPELSNAKLVELKFNKATPIAKQQFNTTGIQHAMRKSEQLCTFKESFILDAQSENI